MSEPVVQKISMEVQTRPEVPIKQTPQIVQDQEIQTEPVTFVENSEPSSHLPPATKDPSSSSRANRVAGTKRNDTHAKNMINLLSILKLLNSIFFLSFVLFPASM